MEKFRRLRSPWSSKTKNRDTSPATSSHNILVPQSTSELRQTGSLGAKDSTQPRTDEVSPSRRLSSATTEVALEMSYEQSQGKCDNPLGLSTLYEPDSRPTLDIIFIHGLGGTSRNTWSKNKDPELFWPQRWLPEERNICTARVLSFGYQAAVPGSVGSKTILNISDFAKDLLFSMKYGQDRSLNDLHIGKTPVVFVAHSMGGLVVKKAYILGQNDNDYKNIIKSVTAILFLATPHRGSRSANQLDKLLRASNPLFSRKQYVAELARNSQTLESINEEFRNLAPKLQIFSFYETLETYIGPTRMMVLEKDSSILGYPEEVSKSLVADHHDVCKFSDRQDPNYISIRNVLKTLVGRARDAKMTATIPNPTENLKKAQILLAITEGPDDDLKFFRDRWTVGTCDWIKYDPSFKEWLHYTPRSTILWLHALPAMGKSVMTAFIIEHLKSLGMHCTYFFFRFGDQTKRSPNNLLRSFAYQSAVQLPEFQKKLCALHDDGLRLEKTDARTIWNKLFATCLFKMDLQKPMYWLVDGLDESDSPQTLLDILSGISDSAVPVYLLVVSRFTEKLSLAFDRIESTIDVQVHPIEAQESDIHLFVRNELRYLRGNEGFKDRLLQRILERASGNFLWVTLAVEEILECKTEGRIEKALTEIPSGMEPLYQRMEMTIAHSLREDDRDLAKHILVWACCSRRAMTLAELSQALEPDFPAVLDLQHAISEVCGHFVVVDSMSNVAMIHQTARDYLINTPNLVFSIQASKAHEQLFTKSLSFLIDPALRAKLGQVSALPASPFLHYAVTSWPFHLNLSQLSRSISISPLSLLGKFFRGPYVLTWIHALAYFDQMKVLVQVSKNLNIFIAKKRKLHEDEIPDQERIEDLELLEAWAIDLVKILAKFGPNLIQQPSAIHKLIPPFCPKDSIIYQQHDKKDASQSALSVRGLANTAWDDCLAKISLGNGLRALQIICVGHYFCILMTSGTIILYDSISLREIRRIEHGEFVFAIACSAGGGKFVSYGYLTTKTWAIPLGQQSLSVASPKDCKALALIWIQNDGAILLGGDDKTIRKLDVNARNPGWQILDPELLKEETAISGTNTNSPRYMAFSPDGLQVAVAYRGYPLSIWNLSELRSVARCKRVAEKRKDITNAWTAVDRVLWHPTSGEILGLYMDGCVFKWNPYEEVGQEVRARASEVECSPDGALFATSDITGNIKIWNYDHFALIYQLSCDNDVTGICFSPDCRRLYDLSGSLCNIWEPNVLIRLTESDEPGSERESEAASTIRNAPASETEAETSDSITALAANSKELIYCAGNDAGLIELFDLGRSKKEIFRIEIYKSSRFLMIDLLVFSNDGHYVAYSELGGQIGVFCLTRKSSQPGDIHVESVFNVKTIEGVHHLLFSPDSRYFLFDGRSTGKVWELETGTSITDFEGTNHATDRKLFNHPRTKDDLLSLTASGVMVSSWTDANFAKKPHHAYGENSSSLGIQPARTPPSLRRSSAATTSLAEVKLVVSDVIGSEDGSFLLLSLSQTSSGALSEPCALIIETASLSVDQPNNEGFVSVLEIPETIVVGINKPLGILSGPRVVFLDNESWICTWRLGSGNESTGLVRHFFIPRDWLNVEALDLCLVMDDGTFLCPRYGEVAVIGSTLGRQW